MRVLLLLTLLAPLFVCAAGGAASDEGPAAGGNTVARWPAARAKCRPVPLMDVEIDGFLGRRIDQNLPSVLAALESPIPRGFEARAAGRKPPPETRRLAADSDLYKWLEGACYVYARTKNAKLRAEIDRIAGLILQCQEPDGYINTQVSMKKRFDPRVNHDLYIAGHFFEAAVAHHRATGREDLLDAACRWADYLIAEYKKGNPYYQRVGTREHPEYELGFLRLGREAGRPAYVDFAATLANMSAVGPKVADIHAGGGKLHAVRTGYLLAGRADLYLETGRDDMIEHLPELWTELVETRMYVTGAIGSHGEGISNTPFDLPPSRPGANHRHLGETCACVAMIMFTWRMHGITGRSECFDVIERALYNHYLGALSLDNLANFYYNPLHVTGDLAGKSDHGHRPMCTRCRLPDIHSTACCMPNAWRFLGALPEYVFSRDEDGLFVNLYTSATMRHALPDGRTVHLAIETRYPWEETVRVRHLGEEPVEFALRLRVPAWCQEATWSVDGEAPQTSAGGRYWAIRRTWQPGQTAELRMPMPPRMVVPDPRIEAVAGKVAFARGPIVYCLEKPDVEVPVEAARVAMKPREAREKVRAEWRKDLLDGVCVLRVPGKAVAAPVASGPRVSPPRVASGEARDTELTLVPFYARANRSDDSRWVVFLPNDAMSGRPDVEPSLAARSTVVASHVWKADTPRAVHDGIVPENSSDHSIPRFTWWDHCGTEEGIEYRLPEPTEVSTVEVYWFDDRPTGGDCRVPASWTLLYRDGDTWTPVEARNEYGTARDTFNRVEFSPVRAAALRIKVQLQPKCSGGILEWRVR
jgi:hypothetical protein